MCEACVHVAENAQEELGLAVVGRGFQVAVGVPFNGELSKAIRVAARRCAEVCPTGALAFRTQRACDLCESCTLTANGQRTLPESDGGECNGSSLE